MIPGTEHYEVWTQKTEFTQILLKEKVKALGEMASKMCLLGTTCENSILQKRKC